ncbi:protein PFF0380w-like isoform X4 [Myzus persicae]|uniref:protein PFF0380w-like isoform X4 n=1 Tax=Myzus persicae TaxID=13164 RepID=UPI000B92FB0C|nr:protein PFF0380w-like isoform X4 [Myzus persicae]
MSPSNSKLSSDRETVSCIQNKNGKRSFFRTSETDVTDNDIYYKRKKSIKHSQSEINNAVLTAQNGYMTRNKLKKQLTNNSELVETSVIKDKCSRINNIRNKSETANRNRKPSKKIHKKMLQLGFVFTNDISSPYPGKHLDTEYKKSTPSLFESDSDPEIDYFRIKDSVKDEVEEISTCISDPDDICPAFDKNVEMRTYFNKKSYPINNKSNIISLNTFEEIDQKPSSLYDPVKTVRDSNLYKNISQNYSKTNKSLEVTADSASMSKNTTINKPISIELNEKNCVNFNKNEISPTTSECVPTNTEDGEIIVVTESFISQLKNEFEITKTESQAEIRTQELFYDNNTNKSNDFDKENKVVSKILSSDFEVNQINMCAIDTDIDDICDVNFKSSICSNLLLKQDMDVIDDSHNKPLPSLFTTTNNVENSLMSIFDEPKENILVESYASINNSLIIDSKSNSSTTISEEIIDLSSLHTFEFDNSNSDQPVENYPKPEKNITCPDLIEPNQYFHSIIKDEIKIKTESFYIKDNYNCSLKNDSLSSTNDSFSKKYKNHSSRCYCKNFNSFNINDNKIFTSKIKHFAFNNNAKKVRQKLLLRKHLEANILNMLITKEHKNIIQSREHNIPIFNSISINKKFEKFDFKENDHIEPSILSMLKDVYVDVEYLTEYCDYNTSDHKLLEPQKDNKDIQFNIHSSKVKSINIMSTSKNINDSTSNNTSQNKPINFKPYDEKYDNFDKNKINNDSTSNITKQKKTVYIKPFDGSYVNFNKKKTIDHANTSNSTTKYEPINENDVNHEKYKIIDALISNSKTKIKPISIEPDEKNCANFNKNVIMDHANTSNDTTKNKPINHKPCNQNNIHLNKNKIIDNVSTSSNKSVNLKLFNQSYFNNNKISHTDCISKSTTKNKPISIEPYEENFVKFNKNEIIDNIPMSNSKSESVEPCDQSCTNLNKNKISDTDCISKSTTENKPISIEPYEENFVKFNKNEITDRASMPNNTTKNKPISFVPCNENGVNFNKNKIIDNIPMSNSKSENVEPCDQSYINLNKNKISDNVPMSNSKSVDLEPYDQIYINLNKNQIPNTDCMSNRSTKNKPISVEPFEENLVTFNKNVINYPKVSFIKKNDLDFDSVCNSLVVNTEIDTKSKIKIEDEFYYDTTAMKYDFKSEENPELEIKLFDVSNLSDSTITINKNNESKKEFEMPVKCNDIESENILSSARIKTNYEFTQTKITHVLKEEHTPVPAIIESEIEKTNISTFFEPPQFKNLFDTSDTISPKAYQMCPMLPHTSENNEPVNNLFDLPVDDIAFSLNNNSSDDDDDDDNRLLIEDNEPIVDGNINTNKTCIFKLPDNSKDERKINYPSSAANIKSKVTTEIEFCEKNLTNTKKEQSSEINLIENEEVSNPILSTKKCVISNNNCENAYLLKEKENSLDDCMSFEMCNEFYKIKSLNKSIVNKNESLPKYIQDILKEMYVDELFVSTCQHMVDFYNDDDQLKNNVFFQTDKCRIIPSKKLACDIINTKVAEKKYSEFNQSISINGETLLGAKINYENQETNEPSNTTTKENNSVSLQKPNDVKTKYPELKQSISTKGETILKSEINNRNQQKKTVNPTITKQKSNSLQEAKNVPSNMKIRIHLREFIVSDKSFDDILESKEFRNLRFFGEEEIASSIGVFIFEQIIDAPIITGLSVYRASYDQLNNEEKNKILASTNLNITCPKIMMLTSITLALAKMLRSDTLIELILNVIRRNILKKQMNTNHSIDDQLIKQVVYFVDICVRLRLLKTLQIFIFDSMVFLPNKYCCIIFISLLLWKNCLPRSINIKEDPVIITVLSFLIAKKKHYSEETVGCDIFQRELINLLSCHFNYTFSIDMPTNFIQHIHKPDFFVSVVMFLKCCNPNDLVEFMVNCLFPIVDNYLNTQQNEMYALQTMESINMAIVPFKITCNTTVATYLNKCKDPINGLKKNGKEHVYNTTHNSYKILQNKFIEYLNDSRPRSPYFEELLMSIILVLGSADYLTSCMSLMQWKPKNELSAILSKKIVIFKSIVGDNIVWDKLCAIDDINTLKCLINSCLLNKNVYDTIIQLYNLR